MQKLYRRYGQVLLKNPKIAKFEAESVDLPPGSTILEIGSGRGILTQALLGIGYRVIAVETDHRFVDFLNSFFAEQISSGRIRIIKGDILKIPFPDGVEGVSGNVPYGISSQLIERLCGTEFKTAVLMFQKEFGERLIAKPGAILFSRVPALAYLNFTSSIEKNVSRSNFSPVPEVDSVIVKLKMKKERPAKEFQEMLSTAFSSRRKKLRNVFAGLPEELGEMRIDQLSEEQFSLLLELQSAHNVPKKT